MLVASTTFLVQRSLVNERPRVNTRLAALWGNAVKTRRTQFGLSQGRLAEIAGVAQQTISNLETGAHIPRDDVKVALSRALGTSPADLFPWPPMQDLVA